jgi:hypothetical protein
MTLLLAERFNREYSCDRLALVVARSIAFALAALDFTESEPQMIVGSMAAGTYLVTHRDPPGGQATRLALSTLVLSLMANARHSSFSRTGLMQSFGGVYQ